jgi:hypothetical protein
MIRWSGLCISFRGGIRKSREKEDKLFGQDSDLRSILVSGSLAWLLRLSKE